MVAIEADSREIRRAIEKLVNLSTACGAEFSRDVTIRCKQGSLSVASKGGKGKGKDEDFIRLPRRSLPRLDHFQFGLDGDELVLAEWSEAAPPLHVQIIDALINLYNLCGKAAMHRRVSPWLLLSEQPELVPILAEGRDEPVLSHLIERLRLGDISNIAIDTFLLSRLLRIDKVAVLMPVGELVNHSALARPYYFPPNQEGGGVAVRRTQFPERFGDECFVSYGTFDSLDSWLIYNFIEEHANFMRSVPVKIDLPGAGMIRVHAYIAPADHPSPPPELADLSPYLPQVLDRSERSIAVSFLLIPAAQSQTLRRVLRWVIGQLSPGNPQADALVEMAERQILDKNWAYYEAFRKGLQGVKLKDPDKLPVLDSLSSLCALQLARLIEYGK
ncbi:MAG: hypothetical protein EPN97_03220 [Alphaproteobacteria bacterium]|nr:MAG: hypothetical protein EPN97_03220 [Alphaproteobacteria bacterium]